MNSAILYILSLDNSGTFFLLFILSLSAKIFSLSMGLLYLFFDERNKEFLKKTKLFFSELSVFQKFVFSYFCFSSSFPNKSFVNNGFGFLENY